VWGKGSIAQVIKRSQVPSFWGIGKEERVSIRGRRIEPMGFRGGHCIKPSAIPPQEGGTTLREKNTGCRETKGR